MTSTILVVYDGVMINHRCDCGVLGMGTGSYAREKFNDEKGRETRGATAGLWLVVRGKPETQKYYRVHRGQQIEYQGSRINVMTIGSDQRSMYVRLEVEDTGGRRGVASGKERIDNGVNGRKPCQ